MVTLEKLFPKETVKDEKVFHRIREKLYKQGIGSKFKVYNDDTYILRYFSKDGSNCNVEALVKVVNKIIDEELNK